MSTMEIEKDNRQTMARPAECGNDLLHLMRLQDLYFVQC